MAKVKICGITNREDALFCAECGADALGFNFYSKSPRYIDPMKAGRISEELSDGILRVGVFVNESARKILEVVGLARLDAIQLHGNETAEFVHELKSLTNLQVIKAFRVGNDFRVCQIDDFQVDAVLLDSYNDKTFGGTGEIFDWLVAKEAKIFCQTLYLAGGLSPENVLEAIEFVEPFAVDVCSGVEKEKGIKDWYKVEKFISLAKGCN